MVSATNLQGSFSDADEQMIPTFTTNQARSQKAHHPGSPEPLKEPPRILLPPSSILADHHTEPFIPSAAAGLSARSPLYLHTILLLILNKYRIFSFTDNLNFYIYNYFKFTSKFIRQP